MRALVKAQPGPGLSLERVPVPEPGPNDVLVRVRKSAICGTDVHIYRWDEWAARTIPVPMTVGHEFMGEVVEVGSLVSGFRVGDRISGEGHLTCGTCRNCRAGRRHLCRHTVGVGIDRPGCFAEYIALPASNAFRLPDSVPDEIAAFFDPFGNAVHAALSFDLVGEDVLVTGAGPIGCMAVAIARHVGARHVVATDVSPYRLELARRMGASRVVDVRRERVRDVMGELGMTEGFDVGLEMSGNPQALRELFEAMNHGGRVALLGIPSEPVAIDWGDVIFKGLVLKGIYGREMFETWYKMVALLQSGLDVSPVLTHRFPAERFEEAFAAIESGQCGKVVLEW
ncbi:MAG: L-threonine 3-dehydrogenase [Myxococcota bacterium]|nr:L-threonine 3-dehydrogenase [Myxococcota bacterium]MDW8361990.1 L-threonine 3-dehydrogenase [Myxococcales bacterium]